MNYNEFIKAVDLQLSQMSEMEKNEWIHNLARTTKENNRNMFLQSLNAEHDNYPVISEKNWVEKWCSKIENVEIYLECNGYEEYGDSYWDRDFSYEYFDEEEIGKNLLKAFHVAETLLFQKEYEHAFELYERLCSMSFSVLDRDTDEWNELELEDLVDENIANLNLKQITLNLMYTKYQVADGEDRTATLYRYLNWNMGKNIKVEEVFTVGPEELDGIDSFMEEWISFLINTDEDKAGDLLVEACIFQGGIARLCETAKEESTKHPVLYKYACEYLLNENKLECEKLGLEAIRILPKNLIIRGEIADLILKVAEPLEHFDIIKECYEAAFYAKSTIENYLRLFELSDYQNIVGKATKYANTLPENAMLGLHTKNKQFTINSLSKDQKNIIRFFNGEFDYIYEKCKNDKSTLGWSYEFKGIAVPLFILLLNKDNKITKAGQHLINSNIYRLGLIEDDKKYFSDQLLNWKEKVVLTDEQYTKYSEWLKKEIEKRVEAVVGGGYRKNYHKAAALITALGEMLESNGTLNGRTILIEHYKKVYPRKRAFKAEFEMFDM